MAKRRRVTAQPQRAGRTSAQDPKRTNRSDAAEDDAAPLFTGVHGFDPLSIAVGLLGAAVVYVGYYPSDSVSVEKGDALWFGVLAIVIATITWSVRAWSAAETAGPHRSSVPITSNRNAAWFASRLLDIVPWLLAAWMMLAAFASSPPGNLRMATNEAWFWVSAAALFTSARRLVASPRMRRAMLALMVVCSVGLAVHGLHQYYVSLPANRTEYRQNPERVLELAGVDAPPGSAERMVFENRLFDGGPTGTFALANSLAAVLLVGAIVAAGVLRFHWHALDQSRRVVWAIAIVLCASCLLAARSRSATLAMLIGLALILIASSRLRGRNPRALLLGLGGVSLLGIAGAAFLAWKGNREWFEEAPASLAFRFQYWRATWRMALDRPLFGAGPGNFQSIYERYRESSATEQIAEPHNLLFETLASGGFIGLGMVLLLIAAGFVVITYGPAEATDEAIHGSRDRWLWLGAILSVLMIWLIGWASRQMPDLQASVFALPISLAAGVLLWPSMQRLPSRDIDSILGVALIAMTIHLMVSGGWTVPGVAVIAWLAAAMLTRTGDAFVGGESSTKPIRLIIVLSGGLSILAALYTLSLRPVQEQQQLMLVAARAQSTGQVGKARATLERAAESDPWSPHAMLWLADFYRWKLILESDNAQLRRDWESCLSEAKQRGGDDPAIYRMIGAQQLHVYQRHGAAADLAAADQTFRLAADWSPANEWLMAQISVVANARGQTDEAARFGQRARELCSLGGNIERALSRQQVYLARPIGSAADRGPVRGAADTLLPEPNSPE